MSSTWRPFEQAKGKQHGRTYLRVQLGEPLVHTASCHMIGRSPSGQLAQRRAGKFTERVEEESIRHDADAERD
jgi:hypothetical protein